METTINGIDYEKTRVYRVFYNNGQDYYQAFFESKVSDEAQEAIAFDFSPYDGRA